MDKKPPMIADSPAPHYGRRSPRDVTTQRRVILAGGLVVLAALCGMVWWTSRDVTPDLPSLLSDEEPPTRPGTAAAPPATPPPSDAAVDAAPGAASGAESVPAACPTVPAPPPPRLEESDGFVRERLTCIGALAPLWLEAPDLARRAAVLLENAKTGRVPRRQVAFMALEAPFKAMRQGEDIYVDPASWRRYDHTTDVLTCMNPARAAALAYAFEPLLVAALSELGVAAEGAADHIDAALAQIEATPLPPGRVPLVRPKALYEYADPALETLPPLQKQLLRMGPANVARLKDYARQVRAALAAPVDCPAA